MFIVANDLSESQRETHKSLSLQGTYVTAYTFKAVKTVFVELFCAPKSFSGESFTPSERTRRQHEQILHRRKICLRQIWTMGHRRSN